MFLFVIVSLFVIGTNAAQQYWNQDNPGYQICTQSMGYSLMWPPLQPDGLGSIGARADDKYRITFDPPLLQNEFDSESKNGYGLFAANTEYTITLSHEDGAVFGGFAILPDINSNVLGKDTFSNVGSNFSDPSTGAQVLDFGCGDAPHGIGHTNGAVVRTSVSAKWTSPATSEPGDFISLEKKVKDSASLQTGKFYESFFNLYGTRTTCSVYAHWEESDCSDGTVLDPDALCDAFYKCEETVDFGDATSNCCKTPTSEPAPAPQTNSPSDSGSGGKDTTPSETDAGQDESSAGAMTHTSIFVAAAALFMVFSLF